MFKLFDKDPNLLLKKATSKKEKGDWEGAIKLLKEAYAKIAETSWIYPIETYLRLPMYLQQAGKSDEAWVEFNRLLKEGYPNQLNDPDVIIMEHSIIYDKMRLFLQREGRNLEAVKYGIFSYLAWGIGLFRQKRFDEFTEHMKRQNIEKKVKKLLKKANKEIFLEKIVNLIEDQLKNVENLDFDKLDIIIDDILFT